MMMMMMMMIRLRIRIKIKGTEKILKYIDLTIEIQGMWNVKAKVISVTIREFRTISKSLRHNT